MRTNRRGFLKGLGKSLLGTALASTATSPAIARIIKEGGKACEKQSKAATAAAIETDETIIDSLIQLDRDAYKAAMRNAVFREVEHIQRYYTADKMHHLMMRLSKQFTEKKIICNWNAINWEKISTHMRRLKLNYAKLWSHIEFKNDRCFEFRSASRSKYESNTIQCKYCATPTVDWFITGGPNGRWTDR